MKSKEMLAVKFVEIDRQHTPTPGLCSFRAKRVDIDPEDQAKSMVHELGMHKGYFKAFPSYLGFWVANVLRS